MSERRPADLDIQGFKSANEFAAWLKRHHESSPGIWLRFFKKGSGVPTVTYAEALDEALCFGWIDGQVKKFDEQSWLQRFTPRRPRSLWSKRNVGKAEQLIAAGRMQAAGLKQIEAAKGDGRWAKAYESPREMEVPQDFLVALAKDKKAHGFFQNLSRANHYAIAWHLHNAKKPETRERRMKNFLEKMKRGERLH
jgi:uncharacterized protein YdeI (YjbR/CyaY-like superfamily)